MMLLRNPMKRPVFFLFILFSAVSAIIYYNSFNPIRMVENLIQTLTTEELFGYTNLQDDRWIIRTPACNIPRLDPWEPSTKQYFRKLPNFICPKNPEDLLINQEDQFLIVNETAKKYLMDEEKSNFVCKMWEISRNYIDEDDKSYKLSKDFVEFKDKISMDMEYSKVECYSNSKIMYHNYFYRIIRKPEVELRYVDDQLSVLVIGIDSVSKSNFIRQFPSTFDFLANNLLAFDFHGYNKVGLNTFPCLVPYLSGMSAEEMENSCWGGGSKNTFDNCTFLWDLFESAGYRTAFVENLDKYGLFLHNKAGRQKQMAHYYGHTLYMMLSKFLPQFQKTACWRGKSDDEMVLNWAYEFQKQFNSTPHFGHFWMSRLTHDNINTAQYIDLALSKTIINMYNQGLLNKTLLIVMSDHGIRYGAFRETEMGRVEENLPFLFMLFPQWFQQRFPKIMDNIRRNRFRLITTFDLHQTLKSIISCEFYSQQQYTSSPSTMDDEEWQSKKRGISLFQHISSNRSCENAGIPDIYCSCKQNVVDVHINSPIVPKLTNKLVQQLNQLTAPHRSLCAPMKLNGVLFVKQVTHWIDSKLQLQYSSSTSASAIGTYIVAIMTTPGNGKFEATIAHISKNDTFVVNHDIRRINHYGKTSYCIQTDGFIKSLCHCI
ncbi:hypothetical protein CHUAL_010537 [Chamberlinius hualienensis]